MFNVMKYIYESFTFVLYNWKLPRKSWFIPEAPEARNVYSLSSHSSISMFSELIHSSLEASLCNTKDTNY